MADVKNIRWVAIVFLLLLAVAYFARYSYRTYQRGYFDLSIFQQAIARYGRGEMIYERNNDLEDRYKPGAVVYKFPPPYLLHFLPWANETSVTPHEKNILTGCYISLHCLLIALVFFLLQKIIPNTELLFLLVIYSLCFVPYFLIQGGTSAEEYIAVVSLLAFVLMRRFPLLAGILLMWLACIKLYPAFLLLYPLLTRQWRVFVGGGLGFLVVAGISLWVFPVAEHQFYMQKILPVLLSEPVAEDWTEMFKHTTGNQGIVKVLVSYEWLPNRLPFWLNTVRLPFVIGLLILCWRWRVVHDERQERALLAFSLTVVTMLICLPNIFYAYFIVLLFPIWVIAVSFYVRQQWAMLAMLFAVVGVFLVDDNWMSLLAEQAGFLSPSTLPADVIKEVQRLGVETFLWQYHTVLALLWNYTQLSPFIPYILWLMLAYLLSTAPKHLFDHFATSAGAGQANIQ